eukprot:TRINITY_DN4109_c0_g1_i2.p2 TRINITY_DN4109_c0_g1~~TRINITY_DN4109_c0_g1_i2.p2  ORF type:complete len:245 (-),score=38.52 TRINITY_DN4109_c0_g1_i2:705-1439(-)
MSSIITVAAISLFEFHDLIFLWKIRAWKDIILLFLTFAITVTLGVDLGIFISIGISILMVVRHTSLPHIAILGKNESNKWVDVSSDHHAKITPGILIVRVDEALYFANMEQIKDMFKRIEQFGSHLAHPTDDNLQVPLKAIIIHAGNISKMDASAMEILSEMMAEYQKNGIFVCFVKLRPKLKISFLQSGIIGALGGDRIFSTTEEALTYVKNTVYNEELDGNSCLEDLQDDIQEENYDVKREN